jgi:putative hydrolase of the HAD superfamily
MDVLLFDFGGTLDADGITWQERFYPLYLDAGIQVSRDDFRKAFYASDDSLSLRDASMEETVRLQVGGVLERLGGNLGRQGIRAIRDQVAGGFLRQSRRHFEALKPALSRLASRRCLGVVSNFYGNLRSALASEGMLGFFKTVADSGALGVKKPESAIFIEALSTLGGEPGSATMIGDSVERDMKGAEALGLRHVLLGSGRAACCGRGLRARSVIDLEALL